MNIPDTSYYMNLGFALTFFTLGLYLASLYIRAKNLQRDAETLEALDEENPSKK